MIDFHYGLFFLITIVLYLTLNKWLDKTPKIIHIAFGLYITSFVVCMFIFASDHTNMSRETSYDYIVILGAGLKDDQIQPVLRHRLETAFEAAVESEAHIIMSGGLGTAERRNEAEAMATYLIDRGIDDRRLIPDDKSTSTWENLINSQKIIEGRDKGKVSTLVVSSNYHLFRAGILARRLNFSMDTLSARVDFYDKLDDYPREYYALIKSILLDWSKKIRIS